MHMFHATTSEQARWLSTGNKTQGANMKKIFLAGIATASVLAAIPAMAQQSSQSQQPQQPSAMQKNEPNNASANLSPAEIKQVQQALDQKGFRAGSADGKLGPETEQAIKQFQQKQGLQQSGQLDEQTLSALGIQPQNQRSTTGQGAQEPAQNEPSGKK
jgi:peptidoglycan hydrolase-like protein with peptidoglycan-binding domain